MTLPDSRWLPLAERWIFLGLLLIAGLTWGMKLEFREDASNERIRQAELRLAEIDQHVSRGILPMTEERIHRISGDMGNFEAHQRDLIARIDQLEVEIERMKVVWAKLDLERARLRK